METGIDLQKYPETSDKMRVLICKDDDASYSLIVWPGENLSNYSDDSVEEVIEIDLESSVNPKVLEALKLLSSVDAADSMNNMLTAVVNSVWQRAEEVMKGE